MYPEMIPDELTVRPAGRFDALKLVGFWLAVI
jgi:hypothetical protein